jgi:hypothetical protein
MQTTAQVGTILIENRPLIMRTLNLESEPYSGPWGVLQGLTSSTLDQKIRSAGWNCFFMAAEVNATAFGRLAAKTIQRALNRIFVNVRKLDFNCLEVTKIKENRFLGLRYTTVWAHSRHIQQGCLLESTDERSNFKTRMNGHAGTVLVSQRRQAELPVGER